MNRADSLTRLEQGILSKNPDETENALKEAGKNNCAANDILAALNAGIEEARQLLKKDVFSIPDFLLAIDAYQAGMDFLAKNAPLSDSPRQPQVVIGVACGDVHDMGKNIVAAVLKASGYRVHDLGKNIPNEVFLEKLQATGSEVLALSTMMSTPIDNMAELIRMVKKIFPKTVVLVGGAPFDEVLARRIGADGYAENATLVPEETQRILKVQNSSHAAD
jgi:dimethylamine corrinoid protein